MDLTEKQQFFQAISDHRLEKRIISSKNTQDIYYTLLGREIASRHKLFIRNKLTNDIGHLKLENGGLMIVDLMEKKT